MKIIYAREPLPQAQFCRNSIFLVGPTPRVHRSIVTNMTPPSWRLYAIQLAERYSFDGTLFIPEDKNGEWDDSDPKRYEQQVWWEIEALGMAAIKAVWCPRDMKTLPGLTTNTEVGFLWALQPDRLVWGAPPNAVSVKYQETILGNINRFNSAFGQGKMIGKIPTFTTLEETMQRAVEKARMSRITEPANKW